MTTTSKEIFNQHFKRKLILWISIGVIATIIRFLGGHQTSFVFILTVLTFFVATALIIGYIDYRFYEKDMLHPNSVAVEYIWQRFSETYFSAFTQTLNQQIALILKEIYDFKRIEIANILNVTEGVVKHLLHDARTDINEKYQHRCAMINKQGICYQCAELSDFLEGNQNAADKIKVLGMHIEKVKGETLDKRFEIISRINPLNTNGANLEDLIMQILRETIADDK